MMHAIQKSEVGSVSRVMGDNASERDRGLCLKGCFLSSEK